MQTVFIISIIIIRMGNTSKNPEDYDIVRNYRCQEWEATSATAPPQLWKNRKTHELAEIYRLYSIPSIQDMNRYEMRSTQQNFVKVYHIALSPSKAMCFNQQYVRVLIEYIPVKLQNVTGLELQEALTIMAAVFKGFNVLSNNFGLIEPSEELIGFNQWGKTKVWLNKQYNMNFPTQQNLPTHLDQSRVEASHVRKIFDLIQRKTQTGQLPIRLKQLFRLNNPSYLEAILIVQQYAYQNLLSLQRFIRTDLYTRRSSVITLNNSNFESQVRNLRGSSNQKSHTNLNNSGQMFQRSELKRIHSVDALHCQRPSNNTQSNFSYIMPFKQNINFLSRPNPGHHQVRSSLPRIHFQKSSQSGLITPFTNQDRPNNINPIQIRSPFTKEAQHIKCVSILSSPHAQSPSIDKLQQNAINLNQSPVEEERPAELTLIKPIQQTFEEVHQVEVQKQGQKDLSFEMEQPKFQSAININNSPENPQGGETCRSIIDKVQSQMLSEEDLKYQEDHAIYQERDEEIQVSGTFNYKTLYQRDNIQHVHQPLEQIGEEEYSKDKEFEDDSKIKESQEEEKLHFQQNINSQEQFQDSRQNIPINFQSFAPAKLAQNQLVSFAPNHMNIPTEQSIQSQQNVQTTKSFQYQQNAKHKHNTSAIQSIEQIQLNTGQISNSNDEKIVQIPKYEHPFRDMASILEVKKRVSIDLYYPQNADNPFYAQCTPVQSKFDVVVRRDSAISRESDRHERPSAFAHLDTDEQIENYVRNKYLGNNDHFHQVKVGRVESQYEKHYVKQHQNYDFTKKQAPKKSIERENNRVTNNFRPVNNKISNILEKPEEDFLDVNFLQKSLDKRYSASIKKAIKQKQEEDQLNIAKLDQGLMKFSTSKASLTQKSSKDEKQKAFDPIQAKNDYKYQYANKWDIQTGFQYQTKIKESASIDRKKKKSVRIQNVPTHQFTYQLSSSDYGNIKEFSKGNPKSPYKSSSTPLYEEKNQIQNKSKIGKIAKITQSQKRSLNDRYDKYVKNNSNKIGKLPKTPSINQIMSIKGDSRLMLSPIPEKRFEDEGRLSYDQLRSFLWG